MGDIRVKEIKSTLNILNDIENRSGYRFNNLKNLINTLGSSDFEFKKAEVFRENYLKVMEEHYANFENYNVLMEKLNSIKNPIVFFDYVTKNEINGDLYYQSNQYYTQEEFNRFIEDFGIEL